MEGSIKNNSTINTMSRFTCHDEDAVRKLKIDMITNESEVLAAVSCNVNLVVTEAPSELQSMVVQIHAEPTQANVSPAASDKESARGSVEPPTTQKARANNRPVLLLNTCAKRCRRSAQAATTTTITTTSQNTVTI